MASLYLFSLIFGSYTVVFVNTVILVQFLWIHCWNNQKSGQEPSKAAWTDSPAVEMLPGFFTACACGGSERQPVKVNQPTTTG